MVRAFQETLFPPLPLSLRFAARMPALSGLVSRPLEYLKNRKEQELKVPFKDGYTIQFLAR